MQTCREHVCHQTREVSAGMIEVEGREADDGVIVPSLQ
jgi:hypothetical protein